MPVQRRRCLRAPFAVPRLRFTPSRRQSETKPAFKNLRPRALPMFTVLQPAFICLHRVSVEWRHSAVKKKKVRIRADTRYAPAT
jgi:hypothetical protein